MNFDPGAAAAQIAAEIEALHRPNTATVRNIRKDYSAKYKDAGRDQMLALAHALIVQSERLRWVAYELLHFHRPTLYSLNERELEALGMGMDTWDKVDTFAPWLAGVAWREGQVGDETIHRWAASEDRWWRRAALVCTIALNNRARGGKGDASRTLSVCQLLLADRDDMVVKAMSWALRSLVYWDSDAVKSFIQENETLLAPRVLREVRNKLNTGLKNP